MATEHWKLNQQVNGVVTVKKWNMSQCISPVRYQSESIIPV